MNRSLARVVLVVGAAAALTGCGYGYGGGGIGYSSDYAVTAGYGGLGYGGDYYGGLGYPGYGYYNNFYYPGTGIYVYDRGGHRRRWTDDERSHWQPRGDYRANRLYQNGGYDRNRDRAYSADRRAAMNNFRRDPARARGRGSSVSPAGRASGNAVGTPQGGRSGGNHGGRPRGN